MMKRARLLAIWVGILACAGLSSSPSFALTASNVLVIYNQASAEGQEIASYYAGVHPGVRLLAIQNVPVGEVVNAAVYLDQIRPQVRAALNGSIDCIVTTKGLPLRLDNPYSSSYGVSSRQWKRYSSLESELTRIDVIDSLALMGNQSMLFGGNPYVVNPYYGAATTGSPSFSYQTYGMRLSSRLDAFNVQDVKAAIDLAQRAVAYRPGMQFLVDDYPGKTDRMELLRDNVLIPLAAPYTYDGTTAFIQNVPNEVQGYVGHGVNGDAPAGYILDPVNGLQFETSPGAVFHTWESYNAYSFNQGGNRNNQGLVAEWIHRGGAAGTGNVEEPGGNDIGVTNEDLMFEMLLKGYTWAEAGWGATYQLSHVNTIVGDPLMRWKACIMGDANTDGLVDAQDFAVLKNHFGCLGGWEDGDFNADGLIDSQDMTILKANFGVGAGPGKTPVPEPAMLTILCAAAAVPISSGRKRRRKA